MSEASQYYYRDPRLAMSVPGRFIVRLATYGGYGIAAVGGVVLWLSDAAALHALGSLTILFLLSRLFTMQKPERSLNRLSVHHRNCTEYLSPESYRLIEAALDKAVLRGGDVQLYILRALVDRPEIKQTLVRLDVDQAVFIDKLEKQIAETLHETYDQAQRLTAIEEIVVAAFHKAVSHYGGAIDPHYLLGALGSLGRHRITYLLTLFDITGEDLETAFLFGKGRQPYFTRLVAAPLKKRHRVMNRAWTARPTPTLDQFSSDITDAVRVGGGWLLVGHRSEYERLLNVLCRPGNPHALLIGDPGSGKTALVHHLAFQIVRDQVPPPLFDRRLVSLSLGDVAAGVSASEAHGRLKQIVEEIRAAGNIILCISDTHLLLKTEGAGQFSGADILLPAIQDGSFSVIGTTYHREFKQVIEPNNEFAGSFEPISVAELSEAEAVQYLVYASLVFEAQTKIAITFKAVKEAVRIAHTYFHQKLLPSSAEDLLKEALAKVALHRGTTLTPAEVIATAEQKVNVKMHAAARDEAAQLLNLEKVIHQKFIDQEEAVKAVADALREYRAGVTRQGGPIASFLFCGPTGVGKTELSKILAEVQFGDKNAMARFDMSEYQDAKSLYRLIGSPDGGMRGALTDAVIEKPYSLILLDEFEKAHADILTIFLQVLDDGRLTDSISHTVDFTNTIIIATSNAHSVFIKDEIEKGTPVAAVGDALKQRLSEYFKPELINRFSKVIVFKPLSPEHIAAVAKLNLAELSRTLAETQAVTLTFDESAVQEIATRGYDPVFGARPLRQAISESLRSVLADKILRGEISRGETITVTYIEHQFVFEKKDA